MGRNIEVWVLWVKYGIMRIMSRNIEYRIIFYKKINIDCGGINFILRVHKSRLWRVASLVLRLPAAMNKW